MISYMIYIQPAGMLYTTHLPIHQCLVYARLAWIHTYFTFLDNAWHGIGLDVPSAANSAKVGREEPEEQS